MVKQISNTLLLLACLLSITSNAISAELKAHVDRHQLSTEEHLQLTIELINSDTRLRAEGVKPNIDLTLLTDNFTLGTPVDDHRYNIYQGRGRSTSSITIDLFPLNSGTHSIPSFSVDGLTSKPIVIKVIPRTTNTPPELFVRSGTNKNNFWINEQVVAYVDLYHRVAINEASFGDNLETEPMRIELLPHWKLEQDSRKEQVQGLEYDVQRVAWAVFPQEAGQLTIQLPDVWVATQTGRKQRLSHQQIQLKVNPLPKDVPANIIIGKPQVHQTNLPAQTNQYELTHWSVSIHAPVAVTSLPNYLPGVSLPDGLKLYADTARRNSLMNSNGIIDQADYIISAMPLEAGEYQINPLRIPYFDTDTGQANYIELPGQSLNVSSATPPQPEADITPIDTATTTITKQQTDWKWPAATALFASLWLTTLLAWWTKQSHPRKQKVIEEPSAPQHNETRHPLQLQLLTAMQSHTLEEGLSRWLQQHPDDEIVLTAVRAVQRLCYGQTNKQQDDDVTKKVELAIDALQQFENSRPQSTENIWDPKEFKAG
ncbi:BatD family protein [Pseudomonadota bacterium]